jgi:hypothetical protein
MTRLAIVLAIMLVGCNDRPQALDVGADDEVVTLPGGGALILRRALQDREADTQCMVRARGFRGFVPMPCALAETTRP